MKLTIKKFDELSDNAKKALISDFGYNPEYLMNEKYSRNIVDAEVVTDENDNLYDVRVFDPYGKIHPMENQMPVYINSCGWSNWLFDYRDNQGNDIDDIFTQFDGNSQD